MRFIDFLELIWFLRSLIHEVYIFCRVDLVIFRFHFGFEFTFFFYLE